jgi:hypothetical protein
MLNIQMLPPNLFSYLDIEVLHAPTESSQVLRNQSNSRPSNIHPDGRLWTVRVSLAILGPLTALSGAIVWISLTVMKSTDSQMTDSRPWEQEVADRMSLTGFPAFEVRLAN